MKYYFSKIVDFPFQDTIDRTKEELKKEGFGILIEIDVKTTLKKKLDVDFRNYRILGACNPPFAYEALKAERMIGTMLPCNVIVQEAGEVKTEVAAVDPIASMQAIENSQLEQVAEKVRAKLKNVIEKI
ncbi:DUF302 domain-containing protein [bacterium]|nr:DUF302 domain-containing protein [bacterium]